MSSHLIPPCALLTAALILTAAAPRPVQADPARLQAMGQALCEASLSGGLPSMPALPVIAPQHAAFCACVGEGFAKEPPQLLNALTTELQGNFVTHTALDQSLGRWFASCAPQSLAEDFSPEAYEICTRVLPKEFPGGALNAWIRGSGLSLDDACSCAARDVVERTPLANGREDPDEVMRAASACMNILWKP